MENLKQCIEKRKDILYKNMDSDDYVSPDMLDKALSVINAQNKYIFELEKRAGFNLDGLVNHLGK